MGEIIFILCLGLGLWFWHDTLRARELAVSRSKQYCQDIQVQFLDESVAQISIRPGRSESGHFAFHRCYHFEFSPNGNERYNGSAFVIGGHLQSIQLDYPDGIIIENEK